MYLNFLFGSFRIAGEHLPLPGDQPTASGVTKTLSSQDAHNCKARYDSLSFCFLFFSKVFSTNAPEKWSFLCSILVNNLSITQVMCWLMPLYEGYSLKIIAVTLWLSAWIHSCMGMFSGTDFPEQTIPGSVMPSDLDVHKNPEKIHVQQCCLHTQGNL